MAQDAARRGQLGVVEIERAVEHDRRGGIGQAEMERIQRCGDLQVQALRRFEKSYVEALMRACDNNISAAARKAGMDRSNFKRVLRKYRSDVEDDLEGEAASEAAY